MTGIASMVPRVPRTCVWEITTACNLRCIHCELDASGPRPRELSLDEMRSVSASLSTAGCVDVSLTGGEPLVRSDWFEIAADAAARGMQVKVVTNGLLLDGRCLDRMVAAGVHGVAVSLDGPPGVHDAIRRPPSRMGSRHDLALKALDLVAASPLRCAAITAIGSTNIDHLEGLHAMLVQHGVDTWQVQLTYPLGRAASPGSELVLPASRMPELELRLGALIEAGGLRIVTADSIGYYGPCEPLLRTTGDGTRSFWTGCMAGCLGVCILSDGRVKGCPTHPDEFVVGDLRTEDLATIWADEERFAYNTRWDGSLLEGRCKSCPFGRLCRAGCTTMAYAVTGTIYDNPYCVQRHR